MENLQLWALSWNKGSALDRAQQNNSGPLFYHLASAISFARDGKYFSSSSLLHAAEAADSTGTALAGG